MPTRINFLLTCRDVTQHVTDYMEGSLPAHRRLAMQLHLALCWMCRNYLDQLRRTSALLHGRGLPPPAQDVETGIVERMRRG